MPLMLHNVFRTVTGRVLRFAPQPRLAKWLLLACVFMCLGEGLHASDPDIRRPWQRMLERGEVGQAIVNAVLECLMQSLSSGDRAEPLHRSLPENITLGALKFRRGDMPSPAALNLKGITLSVDGDMYVADTGKSEGIVGVPELSFVGFSQPEGTNLVVDLGIRANLTHGGGAKLHVECNLWQEDSAWRASVRSIRAKVLGE